MRKIISLLLVLIIILPLFVLPVSAEETITDLQKVHTNLTAYLYTPYYEKSEYYAEYQKVMEEAGELLQADDITQEEISTYYQKIRESYAKLMQDTYDYSSLHKLIETYDSLDSRIFTSESWKKLLSIRDSAKKELDSPTLFSRTETITEKQYAAYVDKHIKSFTTDFNDAFYNLVFVEKPQEMTAEYLSGFTALIRFCAREEIFSETDGWNALQTAIADAQDSVKPKDPETETDTDTDDEDPAEIDLNKKFETLLNAYVEVCNKAYEFSEAKEALSTYHVLSAKSFSKDSWERYASVAQALEKRLNQPHFIFVPLGADKDTCKSYEENYSSQLPIAIKTAKEALIPLDDFNKLKNLCDKYRDKTTMDGLDVKLTFLKTRVSEGEAVLSNKEATAADVKLAIENIEDAHNDLLMAEGHLLEEQGKVIKQDAKTSRFTIVFYAASIVLAFGLALFLSNVFYGKVDWSK